MKDYLFITHSYLAYIQENCADGANRLCQLFHEFIKYGGEVLIIDKDTCDSQSTNYTDDLFIKTLANKDEYFKTIICDCWDKYFISWDISLFVYTIGSKLDKSKAIDDLSCFVACGGVIVIGTNVYTDVQVLQTVLKKIIK